MIVTVATQSASAQSAYWTNLALNEFARVSIPANKKTEGDYNHRIFSATDSTASYVVICQQVETSHLASGLDSFYRTVLTNQVNTLEGELLSEESFSLESFQGVDFHYVSYQEPEMVAACYQRMLLVGNTLITLNIAIPTGEAGQERIDKFFNSLEIQESKVKYIAQDDYAKGFRIGKLLFKGLGILLIIGVAVLIVKGLSKK